MTTNTPETTPTQAPATAAEVPAVAAAAPPTAQAAPTEALRVEAPKPTKASPLADPKFIEGLYTEYAENKGLKEDTYKLLEQNGLPKSVVDDYISTKIESQQLTQYRQEQALRKVHEQCGGSDKVQEALAWAQQNLDQAAIDAINAQLSNPNIEVVVTAVKGLQARAGVGGSFVQGQNGQVASGGAYQSESEWMADVINPKYGQDPAFRAAVDQRLKLSLQSGRISTSNIMYR